jgi:hypothetical protein
VNGELWEDESVFWQNKLKDRATYEVVYRKSNFGFTLSTKRLGKPYFFQLLQRLFDKLGKVTWDTDIPRAPPVSAKEPPKIKAVYGPIRLPFQEHKSWKCGTKWGPSDWRNGRAWKDLRPEERYARHPPRPPPPPYTEF